jgi:hypothetical protein
VKIKHVNFACGWLPMWQNNKIEKNKNHCEVFENNQLWGET